MKIDSDADTRTGLYTERGCGPRGWGCCIFSVSHPPYPGGPRPPPCIALVQESTSPPVFLKRNPADHPGCLGGHPLSVSLRPFSTRRKDVAAHSISFLAGLRFLYADIPQQKSSLRATFFLYTKKEGKDVPRGSPL